MTRKEYTPAAAPVDEETSRTAASVGAGCGFER
jgi:hypothetical protein